MAEAHPLVVVGAGIAGLTAALALARRGRRVEILERADHLAEVGAGIQLSPNAAGVLERLGLGAALAAAWVEPAALVVRSVAAGGAVLTKLPLAPLRARYGAPYAVIHRGDLQAVLLAAVRAEPAVSLHLGACLEGARTAGAAIEVDAFVGARRRSIGAEALIGADGVRSAVRTGVMGGPAAAYTSRTAWRATFPADRWTGDPEVRRSTGLWLGRRAHLVHYPIRSGAEINVVVIVDDGWMDDRWDAPGDPVDLEGPLAGWPAEARALVAAPTAWRKWALAGVPPGIRWTDGRVALLGDAAHAMLPFVAQGGAMAIEDAAVLARALADGDGTAEARLESYERARRGRVEAVAATARRNGAIYHLGGLAAVARDAAIRALGPAGMARRMDWIWGWRGDG